MVESLDNGLMFHLDEKDGGYAFEYALVVVVPKQTGVYHAGIIDANLIRNSPNMILYDGFFDPEQPESHVIAYDALTHIGKHQIALNVPPDGHDVEVFWPQIQFNGIAGQGYLLLISTISAFSNSGGLHFPMLFYATGDVIIQSWDVETQGTVTPDGMANLLKFGTPKPAPSFFHGALAELGLEVDRICWGLGHCDELYPRPKAWFFRGFHSHLHRNGADNNGYHGDISGGVVGGDRVRAIYPNVLLCSGMRASYANVRMRSFANGTKIHQIRMGGSLFGQLQHRSARQMLSTLHATVGGGYAHGRSGRDDVQGNHFAARFGGEQVFAALEVSRELFRCLGWHIGPKMGAEYGWQRQNGHAEDGGAGALRIGNVDHRFFTTALGVGLARAFPANGDGSKCGHISTTITWRCQAMRNHSNPTAYEQGSSAELVPTIDYGARSSAAVSISARRHFDRHWSGNLSWSSDFAHGRRDGHASAQLSYEF
jgi:hypothetical protein